MGFAVRTTIPDKGENGFFGQEKSGTKNRKNRAKIGDRFIKKRESGESGDEKSEIGEIGDGNRGRVYYDTPRRSWLRTNPYRYRVHLSCFLLLKLSKSRGIVLEFAARKLVATDLAGVPFSND